MKICKESKFYTKEALVDILVICIINILLHFTFEITGRNLLIAMFSAVNRSIWEHIKIAVVSTYLVALVRMSIKEKRDYNLWTALFFKIITLISTMLMLFYIYDLVFSVENLAADLVILCIGVVISRIVENIILSKLKISAIVEDIYKYINLGIILFFVIFTFFPLNISIFKDR